MKNSHSAGKTNSPGPPSRFPYGWKLPIQIQAQLQPSNAFSLSLVLVCLFFALASLFARPFYMSNDDNIMSLIAKGSGSDIQSPSEFLVFINVLSGLFLKFLYGSFPSFHWYGFYLMAIFFLSTWGLLFAFFSKPRSGLKVFLFLFFFPVFFFHYFANIQYSIVTFLAAQAGFFVALAAPEKNRWKTYGAAGSLLLLSALLRRDAALLALVTSMPLLIYGWIKSGPIQRRKSASFFTLIFILAGGITFFHQRYYETHSSWADYYPFWSLSSDLTEYRKVHPGPEFTEKLRTAGWSDSEFTALSIWFWQDSFFSPKNLTRLKDALGPNFLGKGLDWYKVFGDKFIKVQCVFFIGLLFFAPRRELSFMLWYFSWIFLILLWLFYFKKTSAWVSQPLFSYVPMLFFLQEAPRKPRPEARPWSHWIGPLLVCFLAGEGIHSLGLDESVNQELRVREKTAETEIRDLAPKKSDLYVISSRNGGFPFATGVFGNDDLFNGFPIYRLSWEQNTPRSLELLKRFHVKNLFLDSIDRKDIFLILPSDGKDFYGPYIERRYGFKPYLTQVFKGTLFTVYQASRKPLPLISKDSSIKRT